MITGNQECCSWLRVLEQYPVNSHEWGISRGCAVRDFKMPLGRTAESIPVTAHGKSG